MLTIIAPSVRTVAELSAAEALQQAILTFPMAVAPLVHKCVASTTSRDSLGTWDQVHSSRNILVTYCILLFPVVPAHEGGGMSLASDL